jgi:hypothetical protein
MPLPAPRRTAPTLPLLGAAAGTLVGLVAFAVLAALWRSGATHVAALGGEAVLLIALAGMAAAILSAQPARLRRSRVPVGTALPRAWWPPRNDPIPLVAACVGTPIAVGAGAAIWLFH